MGKHWIFVTAIGLIGSLCSTAAQADKCRADSTRICPGCTVEVNWKISRFNKSEKKRWCTFSLGSSLNAQKGFRIADGFSLGEIKTNTSKVIISGQKLGRDRVTVLRDGVDRYGKNYVSTIHFNVEVVEGEF